MKFILSISFALLVSGSLAIQCNCRCNSSDPIENPLNIYSRDDWKALNPTDTLLELQTPIENVVIAHTVTPDCFKLIDCLNRVKNIQEYHIRERKFGDIGYNFLIGSEGSVFTGRGFDKVGAHTKGFNSKTLGVALIGSFQEHIPGDIQLDALKKFLDYAVDQGKLTYDFRLFGHRQLSATLSPGQKLFDILSTWEHFADNEFFVDEL